MGFADKLSMEKCHLSSIDDRIDAFLSSINDKKLLFLSSINGKMRIFAPDSVKNREL